MYKRQPYWFGLARCYFDQQMFEKAIEACDYATVADDEFADAYLMKGHSFFQLGNEESAMAVSYTHLPLNMSKRWSRTLKVSTKG